MSSPSYSSTAPMQLPLASQYNWVTLFLSKIYKHGAEHNLVLRASKALYCLSPHSKGTFFLVRSVMGAAMVAKSLTKQ